MGDCSEDTFTYTITDGDGVTSTATVTVTVIDPNLLLAIDDTITVAEESTVTFNVLGNDSQGSNLPVSITAVTQGSSGGTVTFDAATGTTTYTAADGFIGTDSYTYTVTDSSGNTSTATVTVEVLKTTTTTYTNQDNTTITDDGITNSAIVIEDNISILDLNIQLNIEHTRNTDLNVFLVSANGTRIELFTDVGGNGFNGTVLDDEATTSIVDGAAPFSGSFRPEGDLSLLEGELLAGTWTLEIVDNRNRKTGVLNSWSMIVEHA